MPFQVNIHGKADLFSSTYLGFKPVAPKNNNNNGAQQQQKQSAPAAVASTKDAAAASVVVDEKDKLFLDFAEHGKVQTRFPPEASGFLHIGHAKALLINRMLADKYDGKMLFRFDDTNPAKEKHEFETSIIEDMKLLGVKEDIGPTYSSDFFDKFQEYAERMIKEGNAYCDSTPVEQMRAERMDGIVSKFRDGTVAENLRLWNEMLKGTPEGDKTCLRAKIDMQADNKALRDPVLYRVNIEVPHARTGTKYKAYPTYDFCCPIIDSLEGVTHALRTNEYHDRNAQYFWINEKLGLRQPYIQDFSRLNMEFTLMSKRKLTKLVEDKIVDGWDDPRMPTVRGLLRRGMTVNALREFIKVQGMSKVVNLMEWSKIWAFNNQEIDPTSSRYSAVDADRKVTCTITNFAAGGGSDKPLSRARHMKNEKLGEKPYYQTPVVYLDGEDVALLKDGDEVTLMAWGNAFVTNIKTDEKTGAAVSCDLALNPTGDFKKTKYKLTWVPEVTSSNDATVKSQVKPSIAIGKEFDHVLTKKKPEEGDDFDQLINPYTLFTCNFLAEPALAAEVKKGQFIQIERRGFYLVDAVDAKTGVLTLHAVSNGQDKINHLSAKAAWMKANPELAAKMPSAVSAETKKAAPAASSSTTGGGASDAAATLEQKKAEKAAKKAAQKQVGK
jgi:glutamyl-tRNA synthetase